MHSHLGKDICWNNGRRKFDSNLTSKKLEKHVSKKFINRFIGKGHCLGISRDLPTRWAYESSRFAYFKGNRRPFDFIFSLP